MDCGVLTMSAMNLEFTTLAAEAEAVFAAVPVDQSPTVAPALATLAEILGAVYYLGCRHVHHLQANICAP